MENNDTLVITPKTKVLQLIETYPHLEDILIDYVPAFHKLKNPVLRKTVAKIATLQQAAAIGGINVEVLINHLRKETGQDIPDNSHEEGYTTKQPVWFDVSKISMELDVREMLSKGEHPVNQVIADLKQLNEGDIYKLISPFLPAPLIDKATGLGFGHWINQDADELTVVFFKKVK